LLPSQITGEEEIGVIEERAEAIDVMVVETEEATGGDTGAIEETEWETVEVRMEWIGGTRVTGEMGVGMGVLGSNSREDRDREV
jgi:hypothetical protein